MDINSYTSYLILRTKNLKLCICHDVDLMLYPFLISKLLIKQNFSLKLPLYSYLYILVSL